MEFNKVSETSYAVEYGKLLLGNIEYEEEQWFFKANADWDLDLDDMKRITNFMESLERDSQANEQLSNIINHLMKD